MYKVLLLTAMVLMENVFLFGPRKTAAAASSRMLPGVVYQPCHHGWVTYEGSSSCYKVPPHPTNNWYEARKTCLSMGSDLVKITSTQENNYVAMLVHTYFPSTNYMWIGFLADAKRKFTCVDGTPLIGQYSNWASGEPSTKGEDCGSIFLTKIHDMKWNDLSCLWTTKIGYVCEKERPKIVQRGC
ncbi:perlucin-like protein [Actinia tenebrosa]|uniref:Perlucin-like protein n=1 Tax=Actinia tenebrosa TaxID=6105 RepID=A0A6P8H8D5_ACTTE|nr:perlucin-like protein [Actinia tenebrosa]